VILGDDVPIDIVAHPPTNHREFVAHPPNDDKFVEHPPNQHCTKWFQKYENSVFNFFLLFPLGFMLLGCSHVGK